MKICVIGRTGWLLDAAQRLVDGGHEVCAVITAKGSAESRAQIDDFETFALRCGARFFRSISSTRQDILDFLNDAGPDIAITMNFPGIIELDFITRFKIGVFNCHGSLLPRNRGNACPNWSILNGDQKTGLTIHKIEDQSLDSGPIAHQVEFDIAEDTSITDVYAWYDSTIPGAFVEVVVAADSGRLNLAEQDHRLASYCFPRRPSDGAINFHLPTQEVLRLIRASSRPFEGAYALLEGRTKVRFFSARRADQETVIHAVPGQVIDYKEAHFISIKTIDGVIRATDFVIDGDLDRPGRRSRFF